MMRKLPQWELTLIVLTLAAGAWSAYLSPYYLELRPGSLNRRDISSFPASSPSGLRLW